MAIKKRRSLVAPIDLTPIDGKKTIQVVIETPKGSRNKYAFDPEQRVFDLTKVLSAPYLRPGNGRMNGRG